MISEESFLEWKESPETKTIFEYLAQQEHDHRMVVAQGLPLLEESNEKIVKTLSRHINRADAFNDIINIQYEDLENGEDSPFRTQAAD